MTPPPSNATTTSLAVPDLLLAPVKNPETKPNARLHLQSTRRLSSLNSYQNRQPTLFIAGAQRTLELLRLLLALIAYVCLVAYLATSRLLWDLNGTTLPIVVQTSTLLPLLGIGLVGLGFADYSTKSRKLKARGHPRFPPGAIKKMKEPRS